MPKKIKSLFVLGVLFIGILACNLPSSGQISFTNTTTPDFTMTALFSALLTPTPGQMVEVTDTSIVPPTQTETAIVTSTDTSEPPTQTDTPLPPNLTLTPLPPVVLPERGNGTFVIPYMYQPPTLDGNWDDFGSQTYPANTVVYIAANKKWTGPDDLSSSFRLGWDNRYFYVASKVRDDKYVQNETGQDIYKGDSIEVLLDTDFYGDFYSQQLNYDDYQLGISPGNPDTNGVKEAYLWFPRDVAGSRTQVKIGSDMWQYGYRVEAAIPWSLFGVTPYTGEHFGFVFSVSDNDNDANPEQDKMVSSDAGRHLTNPTTWQELILGN